MKRALALVFATLILVTPLMAGSGDGNSGCGSLQEIIAALPYEDVSPAEEADLVLMREEEKLARDVYQAMDDMWGLRVFGKIMWAEQTHMDAVLEILNKYGIPDPAGGNPPGVFTDPALQQLFGDLLDLGSQSLIDALIVGATIEDLDIYDLFGTLDRADNEDIRVVYQNLMKASRNHLRSFYGLLLANDATYEPQYLAPAVFDEIVNSPHEQGMVDANGDPVDCGGGGGGGGGGPGGQGGSRHRFNHQHGVKGAVPLQRN